LVVRSWSRLTHVLQRTTHLDDVAQLDGSVTVGMSRLGGELPEAVVIAPAAGVHGTASSDEDDDGSKGDEAEEPTLEGCDEAR
jgi:hypothetical protein